MFDLLALQIDAGMYDEARALLEQLLDQVDDPHRWVRLKLRAGDVELRAGHREAAVDVWMDALDKTGGTRLIVDALLDTFGDTGPYVMLSVVFFLTAGRAVRRRYAAAEQSGDVIWLDHGPFRREPDEAAN